VVPALQRLVEPVTLGDPERPLLWVSKIVPQLVVVDEILVAQRDADHRPAHQRLYRVLDELGPTPIAEAGRKAIDECDRLVGGAQQQPASELITPPSNAPTTARASTVPKSNESCLHTVAIGESLPLASSRCHTTSFR
jgi:hypothetical protein